MNVLCSGMNNRSNMMHHRDIRPHGDPTCVTDHYAGSILQCSGMFENAMQSKQKAGPCTCTSGGEALKERFSGGMRLGFMSARPSLSESDAWSGSRALSPPPGQQKKHFTPALCKLDGDCAYI